MGFPILAPAWFLAKERVRHAPKGNALLSNKKEIRNFPISLLSYSTFQFNQLVTILGKYKR
jgi:hypothetical protein